MYLNTGVPVYQCTCAPVYLCTSVLVYRCTSVPVYQCIGVPVYHESKPKEVHAQNVCRYLLGEGGRNSKNNCFLILDTTNNISVLVYQCISVSVSLCTSVPVYLCTCALVQR